MTVNRRSNAIASLLSRAVAALGLSKAGTDDEETQLDPEEVLALIHRTSGTIQPLFRFAEDDMMVTTTETIFERAPPRPPHYGIDAGATPPLVVTGPDGCGLIDVASAGAAAAADAPAKVAARHHTNVAVGTRSAGAVESVTEEDETDGMIERLEIVDVDDYRAGQADKLTRDYAIELAESRQLLRFTRQTTEQPILLDGPLLMGGSARNDYAHLVEQSDADDEAAAVKAALETTPGQIVAQRLRAIDELLAAGRLPVGVVKTPVAALLTSGIEAALAAGHRATDSDAPDVPWPTDRALLSELGRRLAGPDRLAYTRWYRETEYDLGMSGTSGIRLGSGLNLAAEPAAFDRCFFFVAVPTVNGTGAVLRVECPAGALPNYEIAADVRDMILAEIGYSGRQPEVLLRADEQYRISRQEAVESLERLGLRGHVVTEYDLDVRGYTKGGGR